MGVELGLAFVGAVHGVARAGISVAKSAAGLAGRAGRFAKGASGTVMKAMRTFKSARYARQAAQRAKVYTIHGEYQRKVQKCVDAGKCFVAGTLIWIAAAGIDIDSANAELAEAHEVAARTGDDAVLAKAVDRLTITKPIEDIEAGDIVLSRPDNDGSAAPVFAVVDETYIRDTEEIVTLDAVRERDGAFDRLEVTPFHPIWIDDTRGDALRVADANHPGLHTAAHYLTAPDGQRALATRGWFHARDIKQGYVLRAADGTRVVVLQVKHEQQRRRAKVVPSLNAAWTTSASRGS